MGRPLRRGDAAGRNLLILGETAIPGVFTIDVEPVSDARGFFARTFDARVLERAGLIHRFEQHSIAYNARAGTLRGLHFQAGADPEAKIVRCTQGSLFDVAVDLREGSPAYRRWVGVTLDAKNRRALYIPPGCAHGYQTTADGTEASYLISVAYDPAAARGIHHADPALAIAWPLPVTIVSERDAALPYLG